MAAALIDETRGDGIAHQGHQGAPASRAVDVLAWLALLMVAGAVVRASWPVHGLEGSYFANGDWSGRPHFTRTDPSLTSALLAGPPAVHWQVYSIGWTGALVVTRPGVYTIATRSDDASEVYLDGRRVVDNGGTHALRLRSSQLPLAPGVHPLQVRYAQLGGRYAFDLLWAFEDGGLHAIPPTALVPRASAVAVVLARRAWPWLAGALAVLAGHLALRRLTARRRPVENTAGAPSGVVDALARPLPAIVTLWTVGLAVRLVVLAYATPIIWPDSAVFHATARDILRGLYFSHDAYRTLAYPYLLAAFMRAGEGPFTWGAVVATQHVLGLAAATLFYLAGRQTFSPRVALGGALAYAIHGLTLFYEASVLTEALFVAVLALAYWLTIRVASAPTWRLALAAGGACGALVLVRPVAQWYVAAILLALWCAPVPARARGRSMAVLLAAYVACVAPMLWINQHEFGFWGISLGRGMGLYTRAFEVDALGPPAETAQPGMRDLWAHSQVFGWSANRVRDELDFARCLSSAQADDRMFALALEAVAAHPWAFLAGSLRQWVVQVADPERGAQLCGEPSAPYACSGPGDSRSPFVLRVAAPSRVGAWVAAYLAHGVLPMEVPFATALVGAICLLKRGWRDPTAVATVLTAVYFTAVPAVTQWPQDRYRLPVDPLWFMLSLHGVRAIASWAAPVTPERPAPV